MATGAGDGSGIDVLCVQLICRVLSGIGDGYSGVFGLIMRMDRRGIIISIVFRRKIKVRVR
jgi:hypothetical protein